MQVLRGGDVQVQQPGHRQVDRGHLVEVDVFVDAAQFLQVVLAQREWRRRAQIGPFRAIEGEVPASRIGHRARPYAGRVRQPTNHRGRRPRRKRLGAWYTPPSWSIMWSSIARRGHRRGASRVLDPACGDGAFLAGAAAALGDRAVLTGVDIDAHAIDAAVASVPGAELVHADALRTSGPGERSISWSATRRS